jgi:prepilin-type processing-associated H-X9-DG protein
MIVIAIIGALLSILLPVIQSARESARKVVCLSNLSQIGKSIQLYANSSDGWILRECMLIKLPWQAARPWTIMLDPELNRLHIDRIAYGVASMKITKCPVEQVPDRFTRPGDYAINSFVISDQHPMGGVQRSGPFKIANVRHPSNVVMVTEIRTRYLVWSDDPANWPFDRFGEQHTPGGYLASMDLWHPRSIPAYSLPNLDIQMRRSAHGRDRVNVLYFDGSARTVDSMELRPRDFDDGFRGKRPHIYDAGVDVWW